MLAILDRLVDFARYRTDLPSPYHRLPLTVYYIGTRIKMLADHTTRTRPILPPTAGCINIAGAPSIVFYFLDECLI